ncbi:MAG: carboxypeptidase-like regulatory domain-containing protein, partial [Thiogranum sp.]
MSTAIVFATPLAFAKKGGNGGGGGGGSSCGNGKSATVSGTVTNNYGASVAGASVTFATLTASCSTTTNGSGAYSIKVPVASYDVTFAAAHHATYMVTGSVVKNKNNAPLNAVLTADAPVIVTASVPNGAPDAVLQAQGDYIILNGSTFVSSNWSQTPDEGVPATISDPSISNPTVTLGSATEYAAHLIQVLKEPPITEADLPPDLNLQPINEIAKGLQDRNQVVAINPLAHERGGEVPLTYSVTTTSGTYKASVNLATELPWVVNTGLRTVPVGLPVMLYAKEGAGYDWHIVQMPAGSTAALTDANTQTPWFTPDMVTDATTYQIEETNSGAVLEVHVGRYRGVIDPVLTLNDLLYGTGHGDGRPEPDPVCTGCHMVGGAAPDNFTPWRQTGHAEAFTQGITTNSHFGTSCFACHSVGYQSGAGGIDDTPHYSDFLADLAAAQHAAPPTIAGLWESMLADQPDTARLSNIQCENCHGPQDYTQAHRDQPGAPRVSLGAEVCGSCHGEPARHGRFQQWLLSNHADYDLARSRGASSGNCARCHSGNGFVAWNELDFDPAQQVTVT